VKPDIFALIEQLEELIAAAPSLPVGGRIIVSRDQLLDFVDAIRNTLPASIVTGDRITRERDRILDRAEDEAEHLLERSREQAAYLVQEHTVVKTAELEAERLLNRAREDAVQVTQSADYYAQELFARLEEEALRLAADIRRAAGRKP
jgi:vacuolar-type H+-ATPase subunit H